MENKTMDPEFLEEMKYDAVRNLIETVNDVVKRTVQALEEYKVSSEAFVDLKPIVSVNLAELQSVWETFVAVMTNIEKLYKDA